MDPQKILSSPQMRPQHGPVLPILLYPRLTFAVIHRVAPYECKGGINSAAGPECLGRQRQERPRNEKLTSGPERGSPVDPDPRPACRNAAQEALASSARNGNQDVFDEPRRLLICLMCLSPFRGGSGGHVVGRTPSATPFPRALAQAWKRSHGMEKAMRLYFAI
jgi:hypothetical protein